MAFRTSKIARRIIALVFVSVMVSMVTVSGIFVVTQIRGTLAQLAQFRPSTLGKSMP
jgi:hypothetical protein